MKKIIIYILLIYFSSYSTSNSSFLVFAYRKAYLQQTKTHISDKIAFLKKLSDSLEYHDLKDSSNFYKKEINKLENQRKLIEYELASRRQAEESTLNTGSPRFGFVDSMGTAHFVSSNLDSNSQNFHINNSTKLIYPEEISIDNYVRKKTNERINIHDSIMISKVDLTSSTFSNKHDYNNVIFNSKVVFIDTKFESDVNFLKVKFENQFICKFAEFHSIVYFKDVQFYDKVDFSNVIFTDTVIFNNCTLPPSIDFSNAILNSAIDFSKCKLSNASSKCKIHLLGTQVDKLKLPMRLFEIVFKKETLFETQTSIYEQLLKIFKKDGMNESTMILDKEYRKFKNRYTGGLTWWIFDTFEDVWWDYGYNKERIVYWTSGFFALCFSFVLLFFKRLYAIYPIEMLNFSELQFKDNILKKVKMLFQYIFYSFLYTLIIFFGLKLNIDSIKQNYKNSNIGNNILIASIFAAYTIGLFCTAFIANLIFSR